MITTTIRFLLVILLVFFISNCTKSSPQELVLFDFETDAELDQLNWNCQTLYSLSEEHATNGSKSLKLELYPSDYPGFSPAIGKYDDWRGYQEFRFDIYNPQQEEIRISVRIDDSKDYPDYGERYNNSFILKPGFNNISILLNTLITSGSGRKLSLKKIHQLLIFMSHPDETTVFYIDYVRLI